MRKSLLSKSCALILGLGVLPALAAGSPGAAGPPTTCSLATLHGTMAWGGIADNLTTGQPYSNSGMEWYDGKGGMTYTELQSDGYVKQHFSGTGTYTITKNCIATVIYDGDTADPWTYFVAPNGDLYYFNNNLGVGRVSGGHVDRISRANLVN